MGAAVQHHVPRLLSRIIAVDKINGVAVKQLNAVPVQLLAYRCNVVVQ